MARANSRTPIVNRRWPENPFFSHAPNSPPRLSLHSSCNGRIRPPGGFADLSAPVRHWRVDKTTAAEAEWTGEPEGPDVLSTELQRRSRRKPCLLSIWLEQTGRLLPRARGCLRRACRLGWLCFSACSKSRVRTARFPPERSMAPMATRLNDAARRPAGPPVASKRSRHPLSIRGPFLQHREGNLAKTGRWREKNLPARLDGTPPQPPLPAQRYPSAGRPTGLAEPGVVRQDINPKRSSTEGKGAESTKGLKRSRTLSALLRSP